MPVRVMTLKDLQMVFDWRNHPSVRKSMFTSQELSRSEHKRWFKNSVAKGQRALCIIESQAEPVGVVQFEQSHAGAVADWGFYVKPGSPKGTGTFICQEALQFGFTKLLLHKVCGQVLQQNNPSIGLHQKLGFAREGLLKEQFLRDGEYVDVVCFGLLQRSFI